MRNVDGQGQGETSRRVMLPDSALAARVARRAVADLLARCGDAGSEVVDTATLLTSEVVTNAISHASPPAGRRRRFSMLVRVEATMLRVEVRDPDPAVFVTRTPNPLDEHGRGLALVAALAKDWGIRVERPGLGKTIWFTCAL